MKTLTFGVGRALAACYGIGPSQPAALRFTVEPFLQGLRELGWAEGQYPVPFEFRSADDKDQFFASAA